MRKLDSKDIAILKKLAPEMREDETHFRSVLPPASFHFATDADDFQERLEKLSSEDFAYLAERILDGSECLSCISPESAHAFLDVLGKKIPGELAERIRDIYESSTGYEA